MEDNVWQGKVRSIGVSNFNRHHLDDLLSYAEIRPVINQIEVHPILKSIHLGFKQFGSPKIQEELTETHYIR